MTSIAKCRDWALAVTFWACAVAIGRGADGDLHDAASQSLRRAVEFFTQQVATEGGYLWRYSEDLSRREGEGKALDTAVWVQPPGTPSVGAALLQAYRSTGEPFYLEAARQAGMCLVRGQLRSGGWTYRIDFEPRERLRNAYRVDPAGRADEKRRDTSTLDDNTTQAALDFLMRLDQTLQSGDAAIHEAVEYGLRRLLAVQYPNGAWPQRFDGPPDPDQHPVLPASYPESWSRTLPAADYSRFYTFNDGAIDDVIRLMFDAARVYEQPEYRAAAERAGGFILLAQMPDPQPAWAQQYDTRMHPAWARKFEPPSITGGESQGVMRALLDLYHQTGDRKYLEPIPRAVAYLRKSALPDGRLARFYELQTNRPLYFTIDYQLTYDDGDMPTHYSFKVGNDLDSIERRYRQALDGGPRPPADSSSARRRKPSDRDIAQVKAIIAGLDDQGRWVEPGKLRTYGDDDPTTRVIDCQTFIRNVQMLSSYLAGVREE